MSLDIIDLCNGQGAAGALHEQLADALMNTLVGSLNTRAEILAAIRAKYPDERELEQLLQQASDTANALFQKVGRLTH